MDLFDNLHIVEYNKGSDNAGFCAMSYFLANGSTVKENITEQKYDRMGRLVSEKAYGSYPDSFSEVRYFYDIAGNITGIIDANGNTYTYITPFGASMIIKTNASYDDTTQKYTGSFSKVRDTSYSPTGKLLSDTSKYYYATGAENVFFNPESSLTITICWRILML